VTEETEIPRRQVRAAFTDRVITVYQAYSPAIAEPALAVGTFVPPFKVGRMTWIKPSFLWMMYRSGWGAKPGQERILAIDITRDGFEWALASAALSSFERDTYASRDEWAQHTKESPVRVQWDPERSLTLAELPYRSLQVGLSGEAAHRYASEWITGITEVTGLARRVRALVAAGDKEAARAALPVERPYDLPDPIRHRIGLTA
jgi:hypothetical protein